MALTDALSTDLPDMTVGHWTRKLIKYIGWKEINAVEAINPMVADAVDEEDLCEQMSSLSKTKRRKTARFLIDMMKLDATGLAPAL